MKNFSIILAIDEEKWLWRNGTLAWKIKEDMQHFKNITTKTKSKKKRNAVVMGRKTWESIPEKFRPLPHRLNCVLSSKFASNPETIEDNALWFNSFKKCYEYLSKNKEIESIFIIGWSYLYNLVLESEHLENIYLTRVDGRFNCDVFFIGVPECFEIVTKSEKKNEKWIWYQMFHYKKTKSSFLNLKKIATPAIILGSLLFISIIWYLFYVTFSSEKTPNSLENKKLEVKKVKEKQEDKIKKEVLPEKKAPLEKKDINPKWDFEEKITEKNNIILHFPITHLEKLDTDIQKFLKQKSIEYRILTFNQIKLTGKKPNIILDYTVNFRDFPNITIVFTETVNGKKKWEKEIIYEK